jgi:lycopene beta-cyclase
LQNKYDYIIAGAGAAGLSLIMHMLESNVLQNKTVLILEKDAKQTNDRTWSFWEKEESIFDSVVYKKWEQIRVCTPYIDKTEFIAPYTYKTIRGIDFYQFCLKEIKQQNNITWVAASIQSIISNPNGVMVVANKIEYTATYCFSSILLEAPKLNHKQNYLLQHFKGYIVETPKPCFDPLVATYMDFRVAQTHGTTFGYVLPFSSTKALVEYTLFTKDTLTDEQYDAGLQNYISDYLDIKEYTVLENEKGIIPMTDFPFKKSEGNIIYIGTAGGNTRGSSGYTFGYIQKNCKVIAQALQQQKSLTDLPSTISKNAKFYDAVLLTVLAKGYTSGQKVFDRIFRKVKFAKVLSFLDDDNKWSNDIQIIWSQPKWPFMKAAFRKWF